MKLLLAAAVMVNVNFYEPDPSLEKFSLAREVPNQEALEEENRGSPPSFLWRLSGYLDYGMAGLYTGATFYREDRTFGGWEPDISNDYLRVAANGAVVEGINLGSEALYSRGKRKQAWFLRMGSIILYGIAAGVNFDKGWRRR